MFFFMHFQSKAKDRKLFNNRQLKPALARDRLKSIDLKESSFNVGRVITLILSLNVPQHLPSRFESQLACMLAFCMNYMLMYVVQSLGDLSAMNTIILRQRLISSNCATVGSRVIGYFPILSALVKAFQIISSLNSLAHAFQFASHSQKHHLFTFRCTKVKFPADKMLQHNGGKKLTCNESFC